MSDHFVEFDDDAHGSQGDTLSLTMDSDDPSLGEGGLRERLSKISQAMNTAREGFWELDIPEGRLWFDSTARKFLGFDRKDMEQSHEWWLPYIHPTDKDRVLNETMDFVLGRRPVLTTEHRIIRKDGRTVWVTSNGCVVERDTDGKPLKAVGIIRDISHLWLVDEDIRRNEVMLNEALDIAAIGSFVWDLRDNSLSWSNSMFAIAGIEYDPTVTNLSKTMRNLLHPDDRERVLHESFMMVQQQRTWPIEFRLVRPNKEVRFIRSGSRFIFDRSGEPIVSVGVFFDITDQTRAAEALRLSQQQYRALFENAPIGIFQSTPAGKYLMVNPAFAALAGYESPEEMIREVHDIASLYADPKQRDAVKRHFREDGRLSGFEIHCRRTDGKDVWLSIFAAAVYAPSGEIAYFDGFALDVTESRETRQALSLSESRLRRAQEVAHFGSWAFDFNSGMVRASSEAKRIYGMNDHQWSIKEVQDLALPEYRTMLDMAMKGLIERGDDYDVEFKIRRPNDGAIRHIHSVAEYDSGSKVVVGTIQDISERKEAEEALRASEERYRGYVDNAPDGMFIVDKTGRYVDANNSACSMSGYTREELLKLTIRDLSAASSMNRSRNQFAEVVAHGRASGEIAVRRKDGTEQWWSIDAVRLNENRYLGFCKDITETRRLREMEARAQRLETAGRVAGQVAHDFNNILGPLMAYPDLIRQECGSNRTVLDCVDAIQDAAQRMSEVNQQLLTLGRRAHYNMEPLSLNDTIHEAVRGMGSLPPTLIVDTDLDDDLMNILGGNAQLNRAIANLIQNARDAVQDCGTIVIRTRNHYIDEVNISYGRVPVGEYVMLTISDTGCGIPDNLVESIFDPFVTTKTADKKRGSGLGLSVVDGVVKDHRGYIDLSTQLGQGTSFYLYFPVTRRTADTKSTGEIVGGSERVMVVDDDAMQREVTTRLLQRLGYEVVSAPSGEEAVAALHEQPCDLIVLDMIMPPGIDGVETYRRISHLHPGQRAIIVSGFSETDKVRRAQQLGAGAYVRKPITYRELADAVRNELDRVR